MLGVKKFLVFLKFFRSKFFFEGLTNCLFLFSFLGREKKFGGVTKVFVFLSFFLCQKYFWSKKVFLR